MAKLPGNRLRKLIVEGLEIRSLMAVDCFHNPMMPEDADGSGDVSPLDALVVINGINKSTTAELWNSNSPLDAMQMNDVDADGSLSPLDALSVINFINFNSLETGKVPSNIAPEVRIQRIQAQIDNHALPSTFAVDDAYEIIATLRSGGRPELGDRMVDGNLICDEPDHPSDPGSTDNPNSTPLPPVLQSVVNRLIATGVSREVIATVREQLTQIDLSDPTTLRDQVIKVLENNAIDSSHLFPDHDTDHDLQLVERVRMRLASAGVDAETVSTIVTEMKVAIDAGAPLTIDQVRARLVELGVDVTNLFPNPTTDPTDAAGNPTFPRNPLIREIIARLESAGVTAEVVATIRSEIKSSIESGSPMTPEQVITRLKELGVDVTSLLPLLPPPPSVPPREVPPISLVRLLSRLHDAGVTREIITTIVTEVRQSIIAGHPMTIEQILTRLTELGVDVDALLGN